MSTSQLDYEDLYNRAYQSATTGKRVISAEEIAQVARTLEPRYPSTGHEVEAMRILGYAGATNYRHLLIRYLDGPDDGLAWWALQVLWNYWGVLEEYIDRFALLISGVPWDWVANLQEKAILVADEYLATNNSPPDLLAALIAVCEDDQADFSAQPLACRALRTSLQEPEIAEQELIEKAKARLTEERLTHPKRNNS